MSSAGPAELTAAVLIERIAAGEYPREVVATIARGFLPIAQDDLVPVLAYLIITADAEIADLARTSLADVPARILIGFAQNENAGPEYLGMLARATDDDTVLETLIRNRALPDAMVAEVARRADAVLQEVIVINHARILRAPEILDALEANARLTPDAKRRIAEVREEFFEKKARIEKMHEDAAAEMEDDDGIVLDESLIADLLEKAVEEDQGPVAVTAPSLSEAEEGDPEKVSLWGRILKMSVSQKVHLAFKTDKTGRMILVRDRNKLVCSAVMRNPRMSETEVEMIAGMRNVDDEVLRLITTKREWAAKYPIVLALCRNPKAPIGVVLPLINRLTLRDLKALKDDKGVSEVVRTMARKFFLQRSQKA